MAMVAGIEFMHSHRNKDFIQKKNKTLFYIGLSLIWGFPDSSSGKESACNAGDLGSFSGLGRSPGEGKCYPRQYSGLENPMDRGAWQAIVRRVAKSQTRLSNWALSIADLRCCVGFR